MNFSFLKPKHIISMVGALIALIFLLAVNPLHTVPTGYRGVITQGGRILGVEPEGFVLVAPWQKLTIFNVRAEAANVQNADGATSDTQPVTTSLTVRYSISPDKVATVFEQYSRDGNLDSYIITATNETFKSVTARFTATELISKRQMVSNEIAGLLRTKVSIYGAQVINIDMTEFKFSPDYMKAINEKVTQEQLKQAADNKYLTVQSEQKQKVAIARAEADAVQARADGEAYALTKVATAQADALKIQNAALAQNKDVLELRRIEVAMEQAKRWKGDVPTSVYAGAPIPFLSVDKK
jgi:regulator of protease activity HflC (stomatin/prohibitin superfamily)